MKIKSVFLLLFTLLFSLYSAPTAHANYWDFLLLSGKLKNAIYQGDLIRVQRYVQRGADVNAGLTHAVRCGNVEIARYFIQQGANVNPDTSLPPLHIAAFHGFKEMVTLLIENKAYINKRAATKGYYEHTYYTNNGTALHVAAEANHVDIVEILLRSGADHTLQDSYRHTALYPAWKWGQRTGEFKCYNLLANLAGQAALKSPSSTSGYTPCQL